MKVLYSGDLPSLDMKTALLLLLHKHFKIPMQQEDKRLFNWVSADDLTALTKLLPRVPEGCLPPMCWKAPKCSVNVNKEFNTCVWGQQHRDTICQSVLLYDYTWHELRITNQKRIEANLQYRSFPFPLRKKKGLCFITVTDGIWKSYNLIYVFLETLYSKGAWCCSSCMQCSLYSPNHLNTAIT